MNFVLAPFAVIAVVEFLKRLRAKDYEGAGVIVVGAVVGGAAGFLGIANLTVLTGVLAGLNAVGIHTAATVAGGK